MKKAEVLQALTQSGFQLDIPVFEALFKVCALLVG